MKQNISIIAIISICWACNGNGKVDETKLNEAGEKLQKTVQKGAALVRNLKG